MLDFSRIRIVEIGDVPFMRHAFPNQVAFYSTWPDDNDGGLSVEGNSIVSLPTLRDLWRALREPETSLVVCHPTFFTPWHWRWLIRALFDRRISNRAFSFSRRMGPQVLRWRISAPVVICDHADLPIINRNNFFLLDCCHLYFKRELPPDRWRVFLKTAHASLPTPRFRKSERYLAQIEKLRPISLGLPLSAPRPFPIMSSEKSVDIFFAGTIEGSSSMRPKGLTELLALQDRSLVVDIPDRRLSQSEFYRRCAQARLTWSPEGHGWDCFRHYEAAMCGSVPLMSRPTIERYRPMVEGTHAVYYDVETGELTRAAIAALADKPRLEAMGRAARAHVLTHHTPEAIARDIVRAALETDRSPQSTLLGGVDTFDPVAHSGEI